MSWNKYNFDTTISQPGTRPRTTPIHVESSQQQNSLATPTKKKTQTENKAKTQDVS